MDKQDQIQLYLSHKDVPKNAQKKIQGGRLRGLTDIKPQWRIKALTEMFGLCGFGWYTKIVKRELVEGYGEEIVAVVELELFININDEWSKPIFGFGGSSFVTQEKNGVYTSDEMFKMAETDALSVCCKKIGIGSDVYMGYSDSKYQNTNNSNDTNSNQNSNNNQPEKPWLNKDTDEYKQAIKYIQEGGTVQKIREKYAISKKVADSLESHKK